MRKNQIREELAAIIEQFDILNLLRVLDFARALNKKQKTTDLS